MRQIIFVRNHYTWAPPTIRTHHTPGRFIHLCVAYTVRILYVHGQVNPCTSRFHAFNYTAIFAIIILTIITVEALGGAFTHRVSIPPFFNYYRPLYNAV
jgi:hypothetical protein